MNPEISHQYFTIIVLINQIISITYQELNMISIKKGNVLNELCKNCNKKPRQTFHVTMEYNGFSDTKRCQTLCSDCFKKENNKSSCYITKKK